MLLLISCTTLLVLASITAIVSQVIPHTADEAKMLLINAYSCCNALRISLGSDEVLYAGTLAFKDTLAGFRRNQDIATPPTCIAQPQSHDQFNITMLVLDEGQNVYPGKCRFAFIRYGLAPYASPDDFANATMVDVSKVHRD